MRTMTPASNGSKNGPNGRGAAPGNGLKTKGRIPAPIETDLEDDIEDKSADGIPDKEVTGESLVRAKAAINIALQPIMRKVLEVEIVGDDGLITHAWGSKAIRQMLEQQQMTKEEKRLAKEHRAKKDPASDFQEARYIRVVGGKKVDCFPTNGVKKAMVEAGFALGIPRPAIRRGIRIVGDFVEIKHDAKTPTMREDCVRVGPFNNRTADLRYRPEYRGWSMMLKIIYREDMFNADQVVNLLENAGFSIGLGEWRPEKDGQFGTFTVAREQVKGAGLKARAKA